MSAANVRDDEAAAVAIRESRFLGAFAFAALARGCETKAKLSLGDDFNIGDLDEGSTEPFSEEE
ncbi:MAG TPA: hypothetical protein VFG00_00010 [Acidothermaceae bacterium]|nr:hypothetical protein [Acidothermaceae bacterium]